MILKLSKLLVFPTIILFELPRQSLQLCNRGIQFGLQLLVTSLLLIEQALNTFVFLLDVLVVLEALHVLFLN